MISLFYNDKITKILKVKKIATHKSICGKYVCIICKCFWASDYKI